MSMAASTPDAGNSRVPAFCAGSSPRSSTAASDQTTGIAKDGTMPYVNIKVTREGTAPGARATTPEQKKALIKGVSDLLFEVMGKPHASTFVVIDEVELENWGVGGVTTPEFRRKQAEQDAKSE
jgi:4-oxalocrotonate tautomerase